MGPQYVPPNGFKVCSSCGKEFPATPEYFRRRDRNSNGITQPCRKCGIVDSSRYKRLHPESDRRYAETHKEQRRENRRRHYRANKSKYILRSQQQRMKDYYRKYSRQYQHKRKATRNNQPASFTDIEWKQCLEYWAYHCAYCGKPQGLLPATRLTQDRFVPVHSPECPGYVATNILPACGSCNSSKAHRDVTAWLTEIQGKSKAVARLVKIQTYFDWLKSQ
jgi:hypothetical protein